MHFTYKSPEEMDVKSLCQGDVLMVTDGIKKILEEVHPYFLNENYRYFIVLTQSCDLVRRDKKSCKSQYITLAAVHSFQDFLYREIGKHGSCVSINDFKFINSQQKTRHLQMVERIYNNTEPDYFFLYKEPEYQFDESMVAYLKVSIALKSDLHYDTCLEAKVMELTDEFKAKLGWLVGNIYSRVGTTDWSSIMSEEEKKKFIEFELSKYLVFSDKERIKQLKKEVEKDEIAYDSIEELLTHMETYSVPTKYDKIMNTIDKVLENNLSQNKVESIKNSFHNNTTLKALINSK